MTNEYSGEHIHIHTHTHKKKTILTRRLFAKIEKSVNEIEGKSWKFADV